MPQHRGVDVHPQVVVDGIGQEFEQLVHHLELLWIVKVDQAQRPNVGLVLCDKGRGKAEILSLAREITEHLKQQIKPLPSRGKTRCSERSTPLSQYGSGWLCCGTICVCSLAFPRGPE